MIPFARIVTYGNVVQRVQIVKVICSYSNVYVLYGDGELYGCGANNTLQLNVAGTQTRKDWVLVASGVQDAWCGAYSVVYYNGSTYRMHGSILPLGSTSGSTTIALGGIDVTSTFPAYNVVRDITVGQETMHYLHSNGYVIYGRGNNATLYTLGGGITSAQNTFTSVMTLGGATIVDMYETQDDTVFLTSTGDVRACGKSTYGAIGLPAGGYATMLVRTSSASLIGGNSMSTIVYKGGGIIDYAGWQYNGQLGNGLATNVQVTSFTRNSTGVDTDIHKIGKSQTGSYINMFATTGGDIYTTGIFGRNGTNSALSSWTKTLTVPNYDPEKSALYMCSNFTLVYDGVSKIYVTGSPVYLPGSISSVQWDELQMPR
jgi:hypothetical protein